QTITLASQLPTITGPVVIDGCSQPGASTNTLATGNNAELLIELDGSSAGAGADGLVLSGSHITIRGLVINRFSGNGILIGGAGDTDNFIEGNFIGTDPTGTLSQGNGAAGILVLTNDNRIGGTTPASRNLISGNGSWRVQLR